MLLVVAFVEAEMAHGRLSRRALVPKSALSVAFGVDLYVKGSCCLRVQFMDRDEGAIRLEEPPRIGVEAAAHLIEDLLGLEFGALGGCFRGDR